MQGVLDERDTLIRGQLIEEWESTEGPKVGSFIKFADGSYWRMSYDWGDSFQYSLGGSFFLGAGYASFSGSLEDSIPIGPISRSSERRLGEFWFFSHNEAGAGRGVNMDFMVQVFKYSDPEVTPAIDRIRRTYHVSQVYDPQRRRDNGDYEYVISRDAMSYKAFKTQADFHWWMTQEGLHVTRVIYDDPGVGRTMNVGPIDVEQALRRFIEARRIPRW